MKSFTELKFILGTVINGILTLGMLYYRSWAAAALFAVLGVICGAALRMQRRDEVERDELLPRLNRGDPEAERRVAEIINERRQVIEAHQARDAKMARVVWPLAILAVIVALGFLATNRFGSFSTGHRSASSSSKPASGATINTQKIEQLKAKTGDFIESFRFEGRDLVIVISPTAYRGLRPGGGPRIIDEMVKARGVWNSTGAERVRFLVGDGPLCRFQATSSESWEVHWEGEGPR